MSFLPKPELNTANTNTHTHIRLVCGASYCGHGTVKCSGYDDDDAEAATGWWWSTEQRKRIMVKCMQRPMHRQECAVVMCEFFLTLLSLSVFIYLSWKRMLMWIIMFVPKTLYCCCCYAHRCAPFFHRYGMRIFVSISFSQVNEHKINIGVSCVHAANAYLLIFTRAAFQQSIHLQLNRNTTNEKQHTQKKTWRNNAHTAYKRTNSNSNNRFGNKEFCIYSMMSVCV